MRDRRIGNKLLKYKILLEEAQLEQHNPMTLLFSKKHLYDMLEKHNEVIVKPIRGTCGNNIRKVTKLDNGTFLIHHRKKQYVIKNQASLYHHLKKIAPKRNKALMIQYCIPLAKVDERPIDFRYIVQRKNDTANWMVTGKHAKVAGKGYIITNLQVGAEVYSVEDALKKSNIENMKTEEIMKNLDHVALLAATCLSNHFKDHRIWGFDMAVDENGHVWIIEANSSPLVGGFRYLSDLSMYETILSIKNYNTNE